MSKQRRNQWPDDPLFNDSSVPDGLLRRSDTDGAHPPGARRPEVGNRLIVTWLALAAALFALLLYSTDGAAREVALETPLRTAAQIAQPPSAAALARVDAVS